jgi:hypothetical protein
LVDHQARNCIDPTGSLRLFDHVARILHYLPGDPDEFAVLGLLLLVPLAGAHAFERLHAAARAASAIGKAFDPLGQFLMEILD